MRDPKREIEDISRFQKIVSILAKNGFGFALNKINIYHSYSSEKDLGPEKLRETIEELGPTFIKFGQIMAERPDIIPPRYAKELEKLQDEAPAFDSEKATEIVDENIGIEKFADFEKEPIAAASIAQVHRATLKGGEEVIVKIRRPGIKEKVEKDLDILIYLSKKAEKHTNMDSVRLTRIVREFADWTRNELDFNKEIKNAQIFKKNLEDEDNIYVPEVYPDFSTEEVLVMEYIDGVKCTETEKLKEMDIDTKQLATTALKAGMKQTVRDGFFHADPHPSNFLIQEDGTFTYLDFGMMGELPKSLRNQVALLLIYTLNEEAEKVVDLLTDMGYTEEDVDLKRIEEEVTDKIMKLRNSSISEHSISKELLEMVVVCGKNGLHLPTSLTLMGKNLLTMEGIGMAIYPDFTPSEEYEQFGEKLLLENNRPEKIMQEATLDIIANKDLVAQPATSLKNALKNRDEQNHTQEIENNVNIRLLPSALILSSAALFAASYFDDRLLFIALIELLYGTYLYSHG